MADSEQGGTLWQWLRRRLRRNGGQRPPETLKVDVRDGVGTGESLGIRLIRVHRQLLETAGGHVESGRYLESIVIAQAAAEACATRAIDGLLDQHASALREALKSIFRRQYSNYNLMADGPQKVWAFLTGEVITGQSFWTAYRTHVERRSKVAHGRTDAQGYKRTEADESLKAATDFVAHVEHAADRILGPTAW